jgi:hypothetical protein
MPGSQTTRGGMSPRADAPAPVAFCCHDGIGTPDCIAFAAHNLACTHPWRRFAGNFAAPTRDSGSVWDAALHRNGLSPSTSCRSPGAPDSGSSRRLSVVSIRLEADAHGHLESSDGSYHSSGHSG